MSALSFEGRVAVVSGLGGLGATAAQEMAARGASVVVHDADGNRATQVAATIAAAGGTVQPSSSPAETFEEAQGLVGEVLEAFGGLDVVVLGADAPAAVPDPMGGGDADAVIAGVFAGLWLVKAAWEHQRAQAYGRIVLLSGMDGAVAASLPAGDPVTGLGLMGMMNVLKLEGPDIGLKTNMVVPGAGDIEVAGHLVIYLAHESCAPAGEIFTVTPQGAARLFMGVNRGYFADELTIDAVEDHRQDILDPTGFIVPDEAGEEIQNVLLGYLQ